jgi:hypothetical protein
MYPRTQASGGPASPELPNRLGARVFGFGYLIRDRDARFTARFDAMVADAGTAVLRTPRRAPRRTPTPSGGSAPYAASPGSVAETPGHARSVWIGAGLEAPGSIWYGARDGTLCAFRASAVIYGVQREGRCCRVRGHCSEARHCDGVTRPDRSTTEQRASDRPQPRQRVRPARRHPEQWSTRGRRRSVHLPREMPASAVLKPSAIRPLRRGMRFGRMMNPW